MYISVFCIWCGQIINRWVQPNKTKEIHLHNNIADQEYTVPHCLYKYISPDNLSGCLILTAQKAYQPGENVQM